MGYIYAGKGDDYLYGSQEAPAALPPDGGGFTYFNSTFDGGDGNDKIVSGVGKDALYGGSGDDYLDGGAGNDDLHGGSGANTFVFGVGRGNDLITGGRDALSSESQTLYLEGLRPADVTLIRRTDRASVWEDSLVVKIRATGETISIAYFFLPEQVAAANQMIDVIRFEDWHRMEPRGSDRQFAT